MKGRSGTHPIRRRTYFSARLWVLIAAALTALFPEVVFAACDNTTINFLLVGSGGSGSSTLTMAACTAPSGTQLGMFAQVICFFQSTMASILSLMYCGFMTGLLPPIQVAVTLFVAVTGILIVSGIMNTSPKEVIKVVVKLAFIIACATGTGFTIKLGYTFFLGMMQEGTDLVLKPLLPFTTGATPTTIPLAIDQPDTVFKSIFSLLGNNTATVTGCTTAASCGGLDPTMVQIVKDCLAYLMFLAFALIFFLPFVVGFLAVMLVEFISLYAHALLSYLTAVVLLTFLFVFAPLFVCFALFGTTRTLFDRWLEFLKSFSIQTIIMFAFLAMLGLVAQEFNTFLTGVIKLIRPYESTDGIWVFTIPHANNCSICEYVISDASNATNSMKGFQSIQCINAVPADTTDPLNPKPQSTYPNPVMPKDLPNSYPTSGAASTSTLVAFPVGNMPPAPGYNTSGGTYPNDQLGNPMYGLKPDDILSSMQNPVSTPPNPGQDGGFNYVVPLMKLPQRYDFMIYFAANIMAFWVIALVMQEFIKEAPRLAQQLAGGGFTAPLTGGGDGVRFFGGERLTKAVESFKTNMLRDPFSSDWGKRLGSSFFGDKVARRNADGTLMRNRAGGTVYKLAGGALGALLSGANADDPLNPAANQNTIQMLLRRLKDGDKKTSYGMEQVEKNKNALAKANEEVKRLEADKYADPMALYTAKKNLLQMNQLYALSYESLLAQRKQQKEDKKLLDEAQGVTTQSGARMPAAFAATMPMARGATGAPMAVSPFGAAKLPESFDLVALRGATGSNMPVAFAKVMKGNKKKKKGNMPEAFAATMPRQTHGSNMPAAFAKTMHEQHLPPTMPPAFAATMERIIVQNMAPAFVAAMPRDYASNMAAAFVAAMGKTIPPSMMPAFAATFEKTLAQNMGQNFVATMPQEVASNLARAFAAAMGEVTHTTTNMPPAFVATMEKTFVTNLGQAFNAALPKEVASNMAQGFAIALGQQNYVTNMAQGFAATFEKVLVQNMAPGFIAAMPQDYASNVAKAFLDTMQKTIPPSMMPGFAATMEKVLASNLGQGFVAAMPQEVASNMARAFAAAMGEITHTSTNLPPGFAATMEKTFVTNMAQAFNDTLPKEVASNMAQAFAIALGQQNHVTNMAQGFANTMERPTVSNTPPAFVAALPQAVAENTAPAFLAVSGQQTYATNIAPGFAATFEKVLVQNMAPGFIAAMPQDYTSNVAKAFLDTMQKTIPPNMMPAFAASFEKVLASNLGQGFVATMPRELAANMAQAFAAAMGEVTHTSTNLPPAFLATMEKTFATNMAQSFHATLPKEMASNMATAFAIALGQQEHHTNMAEGFQRTMPKETDSSKNYLPGLTGELATVSGAPLSVRAQTSVNLLTSQMEVYGFWMSSEQIKAYDATLAAAKQDLQKAKKDADYQAIMLNLAGVEADLSQFGQKSLMAQAAQAGVPAMQAQLAFAETLVPDSYLSGRTKAEIEQMEDKLKAAQTVEDYDRIINTLDSAPQYISDVVTNGLATQLALAERITADTKLAGIETTISTAREEWDRAKTSEDYAQIMTNLKGTPEAISNAVLEDVQAQYDIAQALVDKNYLRDAEQAMREAKTQLKSAHTGADYEAVLRKLEFAPAKLASGIVAGLGVRMVADQDKLTPEEKQQLQETINLASHQLMSDNKGTDYQRIMRSLADVGAELDQKEGKKADDALLAFRQTVSKTESWSDALLAHYAPVLGDRTQEQQEADKRGGLDENGKFVERPKVSEDEQSDPDKMFKTVSGIADAMGYNPDASASAQKSAAQQAYEKAQLAYDEAKKSEDKKAIDAAKINLDAAKSTLDIGSLKDMFGKTVLGDDDADRKKAIAQDMQAYDAATEVYNKAKQAYEDAKKGGTDANSAEEAQANWQKALLESNEANQLYIKAQQGYGEAKRSGDQAAIAAAEQAVEVAKTSWDAAVDKTSALDEAYDKARKADEEARKSVDQNAIEEAKKALDVAEANWKLAIGKTGTDLTETTVTSELLLGSKKEQEQDRKEEEERKKRGESEDPLDAQTEGMKRFGAKVGAYGEADQEIKRLQDDPRGEKALAAAREKAEQAHQDFINNKLLTTAVADEELKKREDEYNKRKDLTDQDIAQALAAAKEKAVLASSALGDLTNQQNQALGPLGSFKGAMETVGVTPEALEAAKKEASHKKTEEEKHQDTLQFMTKMEGLMAKGNVFDAITGEETPQEAAGSGEQASGHKKAKDAAAGSAGATDAAGDKDDKKEGEKGDDKQQADTAPDTKPEADKKDSSQDPDSEDNITKLRNRARGIMTSIERTLDSLLAAKHPSDRLLQAQGQFEQAQSQLIGASSEDDFQDAINQLQKVLGQLQGM